MKTKVIKADKSPREGWDVLFQAMSENEDDTFIISDTLENDFDEYAWL